MFRRIMSVILTLAIILSFTAMASATDTTTAIVTTTLDRANALKELGLFMGTGNGFDLDRASTRTEAVVMLLRMLGEEKTAEASSYTSPFTDVPSWATKYISYAYNKGYTSGTSKTTFGSNGLVTPEQFFTFMLRALGYSDKNGDFVWSASIEKAEALSIIPKGKYKAGGSFTRGDCVDSIFYVLSASKKGVNTTLAKSLVDKGAIDGTIAAKYGFYTPTSAYKMIKIPLKKDSKGDWCIYGTDVISAVTGAKYALFTFAGKEVNLGDYTNVYSKDDYEVMINPNKNAQTIEYLTRNWMYIKEYSRFGQDTKVLITVYDQKATMIAAGIAYGSDVLANGYIELALVSVNGADVIADENAKFERAYGNPIEYKNAILYIEKALVNWTYISKSTGKVVGTSAYNAAGNGVWYRYVVDTTTYPDLAKATYIKDGNISAGASASDAVRADCLNWFKYNWDGTFATDGLLTDFGSGSNSWTRNAMEWNNSRFVLFADANKTLIGFTSFVPSQLKVVDVGIVEQTTYVN